MIGTLTSDVFLLRQILSITVDRIVFNPSTNSIGMMKYFFGTSVSGRIYTSSSGKVARIGHGTSFLEIIFFAFYFFKLVFVIKEIKHTFKTNPSLDDWVSPSTSQLITPSNHGIKGKVQNE